MKAVIDSIKNIVDLSDEESLFISSLLEEKSFSKKEFALRAGDVCQHEIFVVTGSLKIFYSDPAGEEHVVKFAIENWWALDLQSFATQTPAFYAIQALEPTLTYRISKSNHDLLYRRIPRMEKFARMRYQQAYILLQHRMTQHLFSPAEERYEHFVAKYPGLELRIPQKEIASYLGITPEFLSMLRRRRLAVS